MDEISTTGSAKSCRDNHLQEHATKHTEITYRNIKELARILGISLAALCEQVLPGIKITNQYGWKKDGVPEKYWDKFRAEITAANNAATQITFSNTNEVVLKKSKADVLLADAIIEATVEDSPIAVSATEDTKAGCETAVEVTKENPSITANDEAPVLNTKLQGVDYTQAERFLRILGIYSEQFTFQTFDDNKARKDQRLARIFNGTFEQHKEELARLNGLGAGVFVTVNETDLKGRKIENIVRPRVIFIEDDGEDLPRPKGIEPHMVVQSSIKNKQHVYYLIDPAVPVDWTEWKQVQNRVVLDYGSDKNAKDPARVLRLAGFLHKKDPENPLLVHIIHESGKPPYSWNEIKKHIPPVYSSEARAPSNPGDGSRLNELRSALAKIDPDCEYDIWLDIGMAIHNESDGGSEGLLLWDDWSCGSLSANHQGYKYLDNPDCLNYKWNSFISTGNKSGIISAKTIFKLAYANGWAGWLRKESHQDSNTDKKSTFNDTLDTEHNYCTVDLLSYIDDNHLLKKLSLQTAEESSLPDNTVFVIGLSIFSAMAARKYKVLYPNKQSLPIGLYSIAEQPSGTGKSRCINTFQKPFNAIHKALLREANRKKAELEKNKEPKEILTDSENSKLSAKALSNGLFITNATPEGLETTLITTNGFFAAISSEQGLFNSLLGNAYKGDTSSNNNDVVLNGFDGGHVNSVRVTRSGFVGNVVGGIACFAQQGCAEQVLDASNGTGLAERFLILAEHHSLGTRDHTRAIKYDHNLANEYADACQFIKGVIECPLDLEGLTPLTISENGFLIINQYRNRIEPDLIDGGRFSHVSLRGAASKINMQIMKISACLYLLETFERNKDDLYYEDFSTEIPDKHINSAVGIANELLEANLRLCINKGIIGIKAEFMAIIRYLTLKQWAKSEREIINTMRATQPFKGFTGNMSKLIRSTLSEMVGQGLLSVVVDGLGKAQYQLAQ